MKIIDATIKDCYSIEINNIANNFNGATIFFAESNKDLWRLEHNFSFFCDIKTIVFPEWDCDFYDKCSPSRHILTERIKVLYAILKNKDDIVILTTPKAIMPLTIPVDILKKLVFSLQVGQKTDIDIISLTLTELGYMRTNNAQNYGDYAIRGDIIDIANIDHETGHRIDIFGDTVDKIKQFNLLSQTSTGVNASNLTILPIDEVIINKQTLATFTKNATQTNAMHLSIIDGIKIMNYIHYLPFFYEKPSNFFDYIKIPMQQIATNTSLALFTILKNEIDINYQHSQNDNYNKYCYPSSLQAFCINLCSSFHVGND